MSITPPATQIAASSCSKTGRQSKSNCRYNQDTIESKCEFGMAANTTARKTGKAPPSGKPVKRKRSEDKVDKSAKSSPVPFQNKKAKLDKAATPGNM